MISETQIAYGSRLCRQGRSRLLRSYQASNCLRILNLTSDSISVLTMAASLRQFETKHFNRLSGVLHLSRSRDTVVYILRNQPILLHSNNLLGVMVTFLRTFVIHAKGAGLGSMRIPRERESISKSENGGIHVESKDS